MSKTPKQKQPVALVTGASRGIGFAILRRLVAEGFAVHGTATTREAAMRIEYELKDTNNQGAAHVYEASNEIHHADLIKAVPEVDALVCNAGITRDMMSMRMSDEDFERVLTVNLTAPFKLARHYLRAMLQKRSGRIVMISSVVASTGNTGQANYAASKAGIEGMVRSLAKEVSRRNITVNAVAPGLIDTHMTMAAISSAVRDKLIDQIPAGRIGTAEEVSDAVAFLVSAQARYITGATIPVNGGLYMG